MDIDWNASLVDQLGWHWQHQMRPRLDGMADEEYFWESVAGCWSVRLRCQATAPIAVGAGDYVTEYAYPEPDPPPVTTIAWRLAHLIVGVLGSRVASHFGGPDSGRSRILFQLVPEPKTVKNRVHLDVRVGAENVGTEVARLSARGATFLHRGQQGPHSWVTMTDPEGNEFCVT
jgi:hypothetical protein